MTTATTATVAMSTVLKTRSGGRLRVLITVLLLNLAVTRRAEGLEGANSWYKDRHSSKGRAPNHHTRCLISCGVDSVAWFTSRPPQPTPQSKNR